MPKTNSVAGKVHYAKIPEGFEELINDLRDATINLPGPKLQVQYAKLPKNFDMLLEELMAAAVNIPGPRFILKNGKVEINEESESNQKKLKETAADLAVKDLSNPTYPKLLKRA